MYEKSDKAISYLQKECIKLFRKLKTLPFDEMNILSATKATYAKADNISREAFFALADSVYRDTLDDEDDEAFMLGIIAGRDISKNLDAWLQEQLNRYNPVTKYVYAHEVERKQARCAEALIATKSPKEADNALKYWIQQVSQYSDDVEYGATILAYSDLGIEKVRWVTEKDDRVCAICAERDGKEYPIDNIPDKPHYGCRCWVEPVKEKDEN